MAIAQALTHCCEYETKVAAAKADFRNQGAHRYAMYHQSGGSNRSPSSGTKVSRTASVSVWPWPTSSHGQNGLKPPARRDGASQLANESTPAFAGRVTTLSLQNGGVGLRSKCRHRDAIMPKAGMSTECGDADKCPWISAKSKVPHPTALEERLVEHRIHSDWKAFWSNPHMQDPSSGHLSFWL